jgi:hypothetical protein
MIGPGFSNKSEESGGILNDWCNRTSGWPFD